MASRKRDKDRPWRKIIRRDTKWEEKGSFTGRTISLQASYHHTLTLDCGHKQIRRGYTDPPKHNVICKECEKGVEPVSIEGIKHGVFDETRTKKSFTHQFVETMIESGAMK